MEDKLREYIDKELLPWYDNSKGFDFEDLDSFVQAANAQELLMLKEDEAVKTEEKIIPSVGDAPPVKLRIYRPASGGENLPVMLFFHGGGFLFGTVYRQESLCQRYVKNVGCVVVSVEYRLAPTWKAPAPVEDGYSALCYVANHREELGIDPTRIALCGLSAGGTIVAALSMMTRDRKGPKPVLQMPLYGEMDWHMETKSCKAITSPKVWCYENNKTSWDLYLGEDKAVDYYDSPSLCKDLSDLPPLFSYVGTLDPVHDENLAFWQRMEEAGIPVEGHVFKGAYHCFELGTPEAEKSRMAYDLSYSALEKAFGK